MDLERTEEDIIAEKDQCFNSRAELEEGLFLFK